MKFKSLITKLLITVHKIPLSTLFLLILTTILLASLAIQQMYLGYLDFEAKTLENRATSYLDEIGNLTHEDQYVINQKNKEEINNIHDAFGKAVQIYEQLVKLREQTRDTSKFDAQFADILSLLSQKNWSTASAEIAQLSQVIVDKEAAITSSFTIPSNASQSNTPPGSGFSQQVVHTDAGDFLVDLIAADLASTRVMVDTASSGDCFNNCPVLSLGDYVSRNGAYAGVNGSYFCPAEYPSCSGKTNTFDTLLMNKNKVYFNSANNVYSVVPVVVFLESSVRFIGQSLGWGRDTSPDSLIANRPLLVSGGQDVWTSGGEPKEQIQTVRGFVANRGNTVYIGMVFNVNLVQDAKVLTALGMDNALNLDDGGSAALWFGRYKVGPGRNIPNAILFVRK